METTSTLSPFDEWQDRALTRVFRCTVHNDKKHEGEYYLQDLAASMFEPEEKPHLTVDHLDLIVLEAIPAVSLTNPIKFLYKAWLAAKKEEMSFKQEPPKRQVFEQVQEVCLTYISTSLTDPEEGVFGHRSAVDHGLVAILNDAEYRAINNGFLDRLVGMTRESPTLADAMVRCLWGAALLVKESRISIQLLSWFIKHQPIVDAIPRFQPVHGYPANPAFHKRHPIETKTFLGPFVFHSPLQSDRISSYYDTFAPQPGSSSETIRLELNTIWDTLFPSISTLAKNVASRNWLFRWFADVVNSNHKRMASHFNTLNTCGDAFMLNATVLFHRLCDPFVRWDTHRKPHLSKIDSASVDYFKGDPFVDIDDETKLGTDSKEAKEYFEASESKETKPVTQMFFIMVGLHQYGLNSFINVVRRHEESLKSIDRETVAIEGQLTTEQPPLARGILQTRLKMLSGKRHKIYSLKNGWMAVLSSDFQLSALRMTTFQMAWLVRLVGRPHPYPDEAINLASVPAEAPMEFKTLPEYFFETIISHLKFVLSTRPDFLEAHMKDAIVTFCLVFLAQYHYFTNPYLPAGLVTVLRYGLPYNESRGPLEDELRGGSSKLAESHLMRALINIFIRIERTGSQSQFYEKFSIRYEVFEVIDKLWDLPVYRKNLVAERRKDTQFFIQFANYLLNDSTFLLDEAQSAFMKIHELQAELAGMQTLPKDNTERKEKESELASAQRNAKSYTPLANKVILMLRRFTELLPETFAHNEIVHRLAGMLDKNLELMAVKQQLLKVQKPEQYSFYPKQLLQDLMVTFINLRHEKSFINAVATDGRSYKPTTFAKAEGIATSRNLWQSNEQLGHWKQMAAEMQEENIKEVLFDEVYQEMEPPDEFIDRLMGSLMIDPVALPSGAVVDRSTIVQHLLSDKTDPYTRVPMTEDMVVPVDDLRERLKEFREKVNQECQRRISESVKEQASLDSQDPMDLS